MKRVSKKDAVVMECPRCQKTVVGTGGPELAWVNLYYHVLREHGEMMDLEEARDIAAGRVREAAEEAVPF